MQRLWKNGCLLLMCILLSSCGFVKSEKQVFETIEDTLFELAKTEDIAKANMDKEYYDYHLPFDVKRISSNPLSEQFRYGNETLVMNFRSIYFINQIYYDVKDNEEIIVENITEEEAEDLLDDMILQQQDKKEESVVDEVVVDYKPIKSKVNKATVFSGKYLANYNKIYDYVLSLRTDENMCYMYLEADIASFACYVPIAECEDMLYRMFHIVKSMKYDAEKIIKDYALLYSLLQMEEEIKNEMYGDSIPENGYLEDLIQRQEK